MQTTRIQILALAFGGTALIVMGAGAGYWFRSLPAGKPVATPIAAPVPAARTPLYYQDPDGKADYSPTPKKTADGRGFKPIYGDAEPSAPLTSTVSVHKRIIY